MNLRFVCYAASAVFAAAGFASTVPVPSSPDATKSMAGVPVIFEANQGRLHKDIRFVTRFSEVPAAFTSKGAVLNLRGHMLTIRPAIGVSTGIEPAGKDPLRARSTSFIGNDRTKWKPTPQFAAIEYPSIYPGVDLVYHSSGKKLEYDFVLKPGANLARVALQFDGATKLSIAADGSLIIRAGDAELRQPKPYSYQLDEKGNRRSVETSYRLLSQNRVGFRTTSYDKALSLVIDPIIAQTSFLTGTGQEIATAAAFDAAGRLWVAGNSTSDDFPLAGEPFLIARSGVRDVFVAAIDSSKSGVDSLIYSSFVGGTGDDEVRAIAMAEDGTVTIAGSTTSTDFPLRAEYKDANGGGRDAFVTQLNILGKGDDSLWFSTYFGGAGTDWAQAVFVRQGRIYVTGSAQSSDLPVPNASPMQPANRGGYDAYLLILTPAAGAKSSGTYVTYLGGPGTDAGTGVGLDRNGLVLVSGYTTSDDFPVTFGAYNSARSGGSDGFLTRVDPSKDGLDALSYSTYFGGSGLDQAQALAVDSTGGIYIGGFTMSRDFPIFGDGPQIQNAGEADGFVIRFDLTKPIGEQVTWSTYFGGSGADIVEAMYITPDNRLRLAGYTFSSDFPVIGAEADSVLRGGQDGFVVYLNPARFGPAGFECASYVGGDQLDAIFGITANSQGTVFVVGGTNSRRFIAADVDPSADQRSGPDDAFVFRLRRCGSQ